MGALGERRGASWGYHCRRRWLVALISVCSVLATGACTSPARELSRYALTHGPAFQHPRHVVFMPELPLASTGKVDRVALRRLALEHRQMESTA